MRRWVLLAAIATGCRPGPSSDDAAARAEADGVAADEQAARPGSTASGPATTSDRSGETKAGTGITSDTKAGDTKAGTGITSDTNPGDTKAVATANTEPDPLTTPASRSTSIGTCTEGRLEGGIPLPLTAPGLLFHPDKDPGSRFGTVELVAGLVRAAGAVERASPGAPLTVSDLAREGGGEISRHASHRSGRDVDVLFYLRREDGQPLVPAKAIPLDPEGRGTDYGDLADPADDVPVTLDAARTWSFLAALLADESAAVQRIFVVEHLRRRLLDEARRVEAPAELIQRFAELTCQPGFPHDDHMHVRVFCSTDDIAAGCIDAPPIYPWRTAALTEAGVEPVLAGRGDDEAPKPKRKPDIKTIEQARAEAGPMHEDVIAFLDRRQSWVKRPHPGRRWCR